MEAQERPHAVVADADPAARRALRDALQAAGVVVVAEGHDGREAVGLTLYYRPDVALLAVAMPRLDGIAATRQIVSEAPEQLVLLLTDPDEEHLGVAGLHAGAVGFLPKDVDAEGLCDAVARVLAGEDLLTRAQRRAVEASVPVATGPALSPRELQVLEGMAAGRSNREIGKELWVSEDTVKVHAKKLFVKTGVHDRAAAVAWAFRRGVLC